MIPNIDAVIKIGGSAITKKDEMEVLNPEALQMAVDCIRQCIESGASVVIVHGAGSFGHHHAKRYEINKGFSDCTSKDEKDRKMIGFSLTRQSVQKLNQLVLKAFLDAGIPVVACSPGSSWRTRQHEPVSWPRETIGHLLENKLVPILHGDCCIDETGGCCILSGDTIIKTLCLSFNVKRAVFITDVAGVFDRPPFEPGAQLLKTIYVKEDGTVKQHIGMCQSQNDVTGGMLLKLKTAVQIVSLTKGRCPVIVCAVNSCNPSYLLSEFDVKNAKCTKICLSK